MMYDNCTCAVLLACTSLGGPSSQVGMFKPLHRHNDDIAMECCVEIDD
jgi:hypothetical protein